MLARQKRSCASYDGCLQREKCKVKGSGCIRTREHFLNLIDMGIDRMGTSYRSTALVLGLDKT